MASPRRLSRPLLSLLAALRRAFWPTVELLGAALLVACLAFYSPHLAVGLAGLLLIVVANFRSPRPPRDREVGV